MNEPTENQKSDGTVSLVKPCEECVCPVCSIRLAPYETVTVTVRTLDGTSRDARCLHSLDKRGTGQPDTKPTNPKDACGIRKVPVSVVPQPVLAEVGLALLEGALKYGRHNYRDAGVRASVYQDAVWRHMAAWWEGEDIDKDSGLSHVTKAMAGLVVLRDSMLRGNWIDDRPPKSQPGWIDELNQKASALLDKYPDPLPAHLATDDMRKEDTRKEDTRKEDGRNCGNCSHGRDANDSTCIYRADRRLWAPVYRATDAAEAKERKDCGTCAKDKVMLSGALNPDCEGCVFAGSLGGELKYTKWARREDKGAKQ